MKRRRYNVIDVNPQYYSGKLTMSAANTTTTTEYVFPVSRFQTTTGHAVVIELLKVYVQFSDWDAMATVTEMHDHMSTVFSTKNFAVTAVQWDEPSVFAMFAVDRYGAFTAPGTFDMP